MPRWTVYAMQPDARKFWRWAMAISAALFFGPLALVLSWRGASPALPELISTATSQMDFWARGASVLVVLGIGLLCLWVSSLGVFIIALDALTQDSIARHGGGQYPWGFLPVLGIAAVAFPLWLVWMLSLGAYWGCYYLVNLFGSTQAALAVAPWLGWPVFGLGCLALVALVLGS